MPPQCPGPQDFPGLLISHFYGRMRMKPNPWLAGEFLASWGVFALFVDFFFLEFQLFKHVLACSYSVFAIRKC